MEMYTLFDAAEGNSPHPSGQRPPAPASTAENSKDGGRQDRIRELSEERRTLVGDDNVGQRRSVAIARHRRRLESSTEEERAARIAVRRSLTVL